MEPAMHTWSFRRKFEEDDSYTIEQALDTTAEMGFNAIEIMTGKANMPPQHIASEDIDYLQGVVRYAESVGVRITCMATYNDFAYVKDEAWRLANIEYIKKWLPITADLGVPNIRMLTGYYVEGEPRERLEQLTIDGIRECVPVAEKCGVNMAIENHNSIFFTAREIVDLIEKIGSDRLTTCPDPSNGCRGFLTDEATPEERETVFETAAIMAPLATESHLKVRGITDDGKLMGFGDDLDRIVRIYRDAGYDGVIAFEAAGNDWDHLSAMPRARELLQDAIDRVMAE